MRYRGFERVKDASKDVKLPTRSDSRSAGYDIYSNEDAIIAPNTMHVFKTDIKAYMPSNEYLAIHVRSSVGIKKHLMLANITGIIDSSYYSNIQNDGNLLVALYNYGDESVEIKKYDRIAQGIFSSYYITDDDTSLSDIRTGGVGSSGK